MAISFYKDRDSGDFVTIAIWDLNDNYFAEGGDTKQSGAPSADTDNTTEWGMNNQFRDIADSLVDLDGDRDLNNTHRSGDGSDHADVATNTTHSGGDGSDHADVATLNSLVDQSVIIGATPEFTTINGSDDLLLQSKSGDEKIDINETINKIEYTTTGNHIFVNTVAGTLLEVGTVFFSIVKPLQSTVTTGTAPIQVSSTTLCPNLNSDMIDGIHVDLESADDTYLCRYTDSGTKIEASAVTVTNVLNNGSHASGDGSDHTDVATNTTHISSDGTDHTYIDQDVQTTASPEHVNLTLTGYGEFHDISAPSNPSDTEGRLYKKTGDDGLFWLPDSAGAEVDLTTGASPSPLNIDFPAGSFDLPTSDPAPLNTDVGSNNEVKAHDFNDSADESVIQQFQLPSDLDGSGTVTFECYGYSGAGSPSGNLIMAISQIPRADDEVWDTAYTTTETSGVEGFTVQGTLAYTTWTETVANLGWSSNDFVKFKLFRDADNGSDTLVGDYSMTHFRIRIPRA